jgi:hypothetical protein
MRSLTPRPLPYPVQARLAAQSQVSSPDAWGWPITVVPAAPGSVHGHWFVQSPEGWVVIAYTRTPTTWALDPASAHWADPRPGSADAIYLLDALRAVEQQWRTQIALLSALDTDLAPEASRP